MLEQCVVSAPHVCAYSEIKIFQHLEKQLSLSATTNHAVTQISYISLAAGVWNQIMFVFVLILIRVYLMTDKRGTLLPYLKVVLALAVI